MSAEAAILSGRREAEKLMIDRAIVRAAPTRGPLDPVTGKHTEIPGELRYDGRFKIQTYEAYETKPGFGDHVAAVQRYRLDFPATGPKILEDDRVTVTEARMMPSTVGRTYRIAAPFGKTFATAQRTLADEIVG